MSCTICNHPDRQAIDQALVAGSATLAALGQQYNLSTSALHRHKAHLQAKTTRARDRILDNLRQGCLFWLSRAIEMVMRAGQTAEAEGNTKLVLQASQQVTRLISIFLKHELPLDERMVLQILSSPQWADQAGLLPVDPNIMAMSRQAITDSLSTPCPEGAPPSPSADISAGPDLDALLAGFSTLVQPTASANHNRKPKTENRFLKREKGGKLPGKKPGQEVIIEESQADALLNKIAGITDFSFSGRRLPQGSGSSKLDAALKEIADNGKITGDFPLSEYIHEQSLKAGQEKIAPAAR